MAPVVTRQALLQILILVVMVALLQATADVELHSSALTRKRKDSCDSGHCLLELFSILSGTFQIVPGFNISVGVPLLSPPATNDSAGLKDVVTSYLRSVTLHVAVYNEPVIGFVEAARAVAASAGSGRAKKKRFQFLSVYTVFAIAFALLTALVGKALTVSIVSLVVSLLVGRAVRNFGTDAAANANTPIFDIVRRPQIQVQHTHSAEEVYEVPTAGGNGGSVSYVYASSPLRSRNVLDSYSPYSTSGIHVTGSSQSDTGSKVIMSSD